MHWYTYRCNEQPTTCLNNHHKSHVAIFSRETPVSLLRELIKNKEFLQREHSCSQVQTFLLRWKVEPILVKGVLSWKPVIRTSGNPNANETRELKGDTYWREILKDVFHCVIFPIVAIGLLHFLDWHSYCLFISIYITAMLIAKG